MPASYGKDPTEAFLNGLPLRDFVFEGIKYYCPDVSKELCRQTAESGGRQLFIHKEQYDNLILEAVRLIDICDEANRISLEKAINTIESAPNQKNYDFAFAVLEAAIEDGFSISEPNDLENYSGQFKLRIPKSLHKSLSEHSKAEGISMNQYCLYLLTKNDSAYVG